MKKILLLLSILFIAPGAKAQGNLQFNAVKKVSTVETVPANKVWKIEGFIFNTPLPNFSTVGSDQILTYNDNIIIDGLITAVRSIRGTIASNGAGKSIAVWQNNMPIWLNAGSTLTVSSGIQFISVLEFNIIP